MFNLAIISTGSMKLCDVNRSFLKFSYKSSDKAKDIWKKACLPRVFVGFILQTTLRHITQQESPAHLP